MDCDKSSARIDASTILVALVEDLNYIVCEFTIDKCPTIAITFFGDRHHGSVHYGIETVII